MYRINPSAQLVCLDRIGVRRYESDLAGAAVESVAVRGAAVACGAEGYRSGFGTDGYLRRIRVQDLALVVDLLPAAEFGGPVSFAVVSVPAAFAVFAPGTPATFAMFRRSFRFSDSKVARRMLYTADSIECRAVPSE